MLAWEICSAEDWSGSAGEKPGIGEVAASAASGGGAASREMVETSNGNDILHSEYVVKRALSGTSPGEFVCGTNSGQVITVSSVMIHSSSVMIRLRVVYFT